MGQICGFEFQIRARNVSQNSTFETNLLICKRCNFIYSFTKGKTGELVFHQDF